MKVQIFDHEELNHDVFQIMLKDIENPSPFGICFVSSWFAGHEVPLSDYSRLPGVEFAIELAKDKNKLVILYDASLFCKEDKEKLIGYIRERGFMNIEFISIPINKKDLIMKVEGIINRMN